MYNNWELILCLFDPNLFEREKAGLSKVMCWDSHSSSCFPHWGSSAHPHTAPSKWERISRSRRAWWEKSSCFLITPEDYTSGSDRVSRPTRGLFPHQSWRIKEPEGEKSNKRKRLEKMFLCSLTWKKRSKYTAWNIGISANPTSWTHLFNRSYNSRVAKWKS